MSAVVPSVKALERKRVEPYVAFCERSQSLMSLPDAKTNKRQRYRGITKSLESVFYPNYRYTDARGAVPMTSGIHTDRRDVSGRVQQRGGGKPKVVTHEDRKSRGLSLGTKVDLQLQKATLAINRYGVSVQRYLVLTRASAQHPHRRDPLHPLTRRILERLVELKWHPITCQLPVSSKSGRIATLVDMLCFDLTTKRLVVVEAKTGFRTYYERSNAKLKAPFDDNLNSPRNQHQLQLSATKHLFLQTFGLAAADVDAAVIRVDTAQVKRYPLEKWASDPLSIASIVAMLNM